MSECGNLNAPVFSVTMSDVQDIAKEHIGRELTSEEMEKFKSKFEIHDWPDHITCTIDVLDFKNGAQNE